MLPRFKTRGAYALLAVQVLLATVPFLHKAFHVDDGIYLAIARHILRDPWRPFDFQWNAGGQPVQVFSYQPSPPLFNYVLAGGILIFGEREAPLHCLTSVFTAGVAISVYALAVRFSARPLLATALVVLSPIFVPGQNLMLDVPVMALGLGGLACHVWATGRRGLWLSLVGGLLVGLATVTKYPALILWFLLAVYSLLQRRFLQALPALALALVPPAVWSIQNLLCHGRLHLLANLAATDLDWRELYDRLLPVTAILGTGFIPVLVTPCLALSPRWRFGSLAASFVLAGVGLRQWGGWSDLPPSHSIERFIFLASGGFILLVSAGAAWQVWSRARPQWPDACFLILWLLAGLYVPLRAPFVAVRHLLWALPPAALLLARVLPEVQQLRLPWNRSADRWSVGLAIVTGAMGLSVGWADMELANLQRAEILEVAAPKLAKLRRPLYYVGEHGFAYYCESVGIPPLPPDESSLPARYAIVEAVGAHPGWDFQVPAQLGKPWESRIQGSLPVNTSSRGVSFYATGKADLPWHVGEVSVVYFNVYSIDRPAGG